MAQGGLVGGRPFQHVTGRQCADHADQHGMGAAVAVMGFGRKRKQRQQGAVRVLPGVMAQMLLQPLQPVQKGQRVGPMQQRVHLLLQVKPIGVAAGRQVWRGLRLHVGQPGAGDFADLAVVMHHVVQLPDKSALMPFKLGDVDQQLVALADHQLEFFRVLDHETALSHQKAGFVPYRVGQRLTDLDAVEIDADAFHVLWDYAPAPGPPSSKAYRNSEAC